LTPAPFAELRIWDLDRLEARYALRAWVAQLPKKTPYEKIAKRTLGRFVVVYLSPVLGAERAASIVWLYADLEALERIILDAKITSQKDGLTGVAISCDLLPDALATVRAHVT
jgi:hypothetical protein